MNILMCIFFLHRHFYKRAKYIGNWIHFNSNSLDLRQICSSGQNIRFLCWGWLLLKWKYSVQNHIISTSFFYHDFAEFCYRGHELLPWYLDQIFVKLLGPKLHGFFPGGRGGVNLPYMKLLAIRVIFCIFRICFFIIFY